MSSRASLLPWIVAFKAVKTTLLLAFGLATLLSIHRDAVDIWLRIAAAVHLPLTSRVFQRVLTFAAHATPKKDVALATTALGYAILMGTEGIGLYFRRPWARWLTVGATSSLIPIEVFEIVQALHPVRVIVLFLNVLVVIYLVRRKEVFE